MGEHSYSLEGELDMASASGLQTAFAAVGGPIRFDLEKLRFLDSSGIAALLRLRQRCDADGCSFRIVACSPQAERVLRIVGLFEVLTVTAPFPIPNN